MVGSLLGLGVMGIYAYSIYSVKQEKFLDELEQQQQLTLHSCCVSFFYWCSSSYSFSFLFIVHVLLFLLMFILIPFNIFFCSSQHFDITPSPMYSSSIIIFLPVITIGILFSCSLTASAMSFQLRYDKPLVPLSLKREKEALCQSLDTVFKGVGYHII